MSGEIVLRPGRATLADWRAIYRGAPVSLDPVARADVEAGAAALQQILAGTDPHPPLVFSGGRSVVETLHKANEPLPSALVRLLFALKLASLAQGISGVRWKLIERLADHLSDNLLPVIPEQDASDAGALSHIAALLSGSGEVAKDGVRRPAAKALRKARLAPLDLSAPERSALLSGTQTSTAFALAGLFEAERVFQSALVAAAFSAGATGGANAFLHPRIHMLHRQPGQIDVAGAFRAFLAKDAESVEERPVTEPAQDSRRGHCAPQMGACLDLLRQAGLTLEREANAVAEDRFVLWQSGEIVAGVEDASAAALAADLIALALREIGALAEGRIETLLDRSGTEAASDEAGAAAPRLMVASFIAENRLRSQPAGIEPEPPSDGRAVAATGVRRLLPMAGTAALVVAIELLTAARAFDRRQAGRQAGRLARLRDLLRDAVPEASDDGISAAALATAADLVRSGTLAAAPGIVLPAIVAVPPEVRPAP